MKNRIIAFSDALSTKLRIHLKKKVERIPHSLQIYVWNQNRESYRFIYKIFQIISKVHETHSTHQT